jgi:hypothetical protein
LTLDVDGIPVDQGDRYAQSHASVPQPSSAGRL